MTMVSLLKRLPARVLEELRREVTYATGSRHPKRLIFDHIPKCAGSTIRAFLRAHYPYRKIFAIKGNQPLESVRRFRDIPEPRRYGFELIEGHCARDLIGDAHPESLVVTVIRDPIDRIASHYYFAKSMREHYLHEQIHRDNLSLKDYVGSGISQELSNHYTQHFSGLTREEVECDQDGAVQKALESLYTYDLVGFQEDLPAFVEQLRQLANLLLPFPERKVNVTSERKGVDEIDETTIKLIKETNALDLRLYRKAQSNLNYK